MSIVDINVAKLTSEIRGVASLFKTVKDEKILDDGVEQIKNALIHKGYTVLIQYKKYKNNPSFSLEGIMAAVICNTLEKNEKFITVRKAVEKALEEIPY